MNDLSAFTSTRLLSVAACMAVIFVLLGLLVEASAITTQETGLLWWLQQYHPAWLVQCNIALAYIGGTPGMLLIIFLLSSLMYWYKRQDISLFIVVVFSSSVLLGAHFLTDVLAGWSLGVGWFCLLLWFFMYFELFQYRASTVAGSHEVK